MIGGWHDLFQRGEPVNFSELQNLWAGRPATAPMSPDQPVTGRYQLLMGPWYHLTTGEAINLIEPLELAWFDRWLKGEATGIDQTATPLHLARLGASGFVDAARWPLPEATPTTYYLGAGHSLGTTQPGAGGGSDRLVWTFPSSPCSLSTEQWGAGGGELFLNMLGQHDYCAANDASIQVGPGASTYTTAPFGTATVLAGPIDATLYASSNTRDTEWVVTLEDVAPDGTSTPLTNGALLGSARALDASRTWSAPDGRPLLPYHPYTRAARSPVTPGALTRYDVEVFPTTAELGAGHRLRVTVTTSDTPHVFPTPSDGPNLFGGVYQLHHDAAGPSFVELPLAPANAFAPCGICG
jgi:putative CocE/NonD family hydrolase